MGHHIWQCKRIVPCAKNKQNAFKEDCTVQIYNSHSLTFKKMWQKAAMFSCPTFLKALLRVTLKYNVQTINRKLK